MWGSTSCASRADALGDVALHSEVQDHRLVHRTAVDDSGTCTPAIKAHGTSGALIYSGESAFIVEGTSITSCYDVNSAKNLNKNFARDTCTVTVIPRDKCTVIVMREINALSP
jgi:hypothetical protein